MLSDDRPIGLHFDDDEDFWREDPPIGGFHGDDYNIVPNPNYIPSEKEKGNHGQR